MRALAIIGAAALLSAVFAAAAGVLMIRAGFSTRTPPSALEARLARAMRDLATPKHVGHLQAPEPITGAQLSDARAHWAAHCASCHSEDGSGQTEIGRNLYPRAPDMRGVDTQGQSDGELYAVIKNGVRLTGMPAWGAPGDADLESWALVAFIRTLPELTDADVAAIKRELPRTPHQLSDDREEDDFLRGNTPAAAHPPENHP